MYIHITEHALAYIGQPPKGRTLLKVWEIVTLIESDSYVRLAETQTTQFDLVWDHYRKTAVILLTRTDVRNKRVLVISIWEKYYKVQLSYLTKMSSFSPSLEQIALAEAKSRDLWSRTTFQK